MNVQNIRPNCQMVQMRDIYPEWKNEIKLSAAGACTNTRLLSTNYLGSNIISRKMECLDSDSQILWIMGYTAIKSKQAESKSL